MNFRNILCVLIGFLSVSLAYGQTRSYYQLKIYHTSKTQEARVENYLKSAYVPALHRAGINNVGVFKPIVADTADLKIYVFIPFSSLDQFDKINEVIGKDQQYKTAGKDYLESAYNNLNYKRIESVLMRAFQNMPHPAIPKLSGPKSERVYELRSYESATENLAASKIKQFNAGGEIAIFTKLNFNAVFYAEVISGPRMPNLMYLTTHNTMAIRDERWKAFVADPDWKTLSGLAEYKNTVSKSDIILTYPTEYSDY